MTQNQVRLGPSPEELAIDDRGRVELTHAPEIAERPLPAQAWPRFITLDGHTIFFRTKGGGMSVTWVEVPGGKQMVDDYRAQKPLYRAPA